MAEIPNPSALFVSVKNGGKSQMAAGPMRKIAGDAVRVYSVRTLPGTAINSLSAESLIEVGLDIATAGRSHSDPELIRDVDIVVILGRKAHVEPVAGRASRPETRRTFGTRHRRDRTHAPDSRRHRHPRCTTPESAPARLSPKFDCGQFLKPGLHPVPRYGFNLAI